MTRSNRSITLMTAALIAAASISTAWITARPAKAQDELKSSKTEALATGTLVNPNLAGKDELAALPGVGADLAAKLIDKRPFLSVAALDAVLATALDASKRKELYRRLWVPINLNTATRDELLAIPGIGKRMAHEFEEYRPYKAMAQFRREIGKYVDDKEVARLERYVFLPIDLNTASRDEILAIPGVGKRMAHEFEEYRPYKSLEQFRREIGKYVDEKEVARLERYVELR